MPELEDIPMPKRSKTPAPEIVETTESQVGDQTLEQIVEFNAVDPAYQEQVSGFKAYNAIYERLKELEWGESLHGYTILTREKAKSNHTVNALYTFGDDVLCFKLEQDGQTPDGAEEV